MKIYPGLPLTLKAKTILTILLVAAMGVMPVSAAGKKKAAAAADETSLTVEGNKLKAQYAEQLTSLRTEITKALPVVADQKTAALKQARETLAKAQADANSTQEPMGKVKQGEALVAHAKGKWIGGADKGIAQAQAALKKATTDAERDAATKDLAKWQANRDDGVKALKDRQALLDKAKADAAKSGQANQSAQAALVKARADEVAAAKALLADVEPFLTSDKLDSKLVKATVLASATPHGLAEFAQDVPERAALVGKLLADTVLMKQMLEAGGASHGKYGQAMQIYAAIQKASPKANERVLQRLALATSLEFATPIKQSRAQDQENAPTEVDPVKRYLHYEKAYVDGDLDPAFKTFSVWEYRMVVDCDAPDQILTWGREMLQNYRPDHITNPDYGWRYSAAVKTEVPYGSQNVKDDLPSLHSYQNIPKNGGVCGRRAFFGRFVLRSFGIPVWGVTQHKHAALSHWTPKGWVVNLGAGFEHSWWDKDEASLSGSDFLLDAQSREHTQDYFKVLRARWVSRILGEEAYNGRKNIAGGFWSRTALDQSRILAADAVDLGPLGKELGEANEPEEKRNTQQTSGKSSDQQVVVARDGSISIPAVVHGKATGSNMTLKSFSGGEQLNCSGGFKTAYTFTAPQAGKYMLTAKVATLQEGQKFLFAANAGSQSVEVAVPYTIGMWQQTKPVEISLAKGQNVLNFELQQGSRGVAIKEFTLTPAK